MQRTLGIDLGTTNSVMAYMKRGPLVIDNLDSRDLTPSVVARGRRGDLLIGAPAKSRALIDPTNTIYSIKRFMGRRFADENVQKALQRVPYRVTEGSDGDVRVWMANREYTPTEISSLILRRLKEDAEARLQERFTRAVITVPAYFGERQVAATREAGQMAGFRVLKIINEPTAAALAYGLNREQTDEPKTVLVYDLGGGTFDISIIMLMQGTFTVMGIEGDNLLGGDDFDRHIMERVFDEARQHYGVDLASDRPALQAIRLKSEEVKITLSNQQATDVILPAIGGVSVEFELPRSEFERMIQARIERTVELTQKAIQEASLTPDHIDQILLVGGSTAIPLVERYLRSVFGDQKLRRDVNPMQCVALGAAIQTALIGEIECTVCQTRNPAQQDYCQKCNAPLFGLDKIGCPTCFMLCDITATICWKCNSSLSTSAEEKAAPSVFPILQPSPAAEKCPKCGKPYKPGDMTCSVCDTQLVDPGGLECPQCKHINLPGATSCAKCRADLPVSEISDITPKSLGIELSDGRMARIIPKGAGYPTLSPVSREFKTAVAGQLRLEIAVFEGEETLAQQNELCGIVTLPLPKGLPRGAPLSVAFGLDTNRTIEVEVKLRDSNVQAKKVRIQSRIDPELQRKVEECRQRVTTFIDRWADRWEIEFSDKEGEELNGLLDQLDQVFSAGESNRQQSIDSVITHVDAMVELATKVRGGDAHIGSVLSAAGKYLSSEQRQSLVSWLQAIEAARGRADWIAAESVINEADEMIDQLGSNLRLIIWCRTFAGQNKLSPALTQKIYGQLRDIDEGIDANDMTRAQKAIDSLYDLWLEIDKELSNMHAPVPIITKPEE